MFHKYFKSVSKVFQKCFENDSKVFVSLSVLKLFVRIEVIAATCIRWACFFIRTKFIRTSELKLSLSNKIS